MDWSSFWGAFFGVIAASIIGILLIVVWDYFTKNGKIIEKNSPDDILEKHMQKHIVENLEYLCPGWHVYDTASEDQQLDENHTPKGIEYPVKRGRIDILCIDSSNNLIILELKKGKAPDIVVTQLERYITHVRKNVAAPGQRVKGIIIAQYYDARLKDILEHHRDINIWTFDWNPKLNKRPSLPS